MASVRITHADGTIDIITTSGAIEEINVQQGDKVQILDETLVSATVEYNPESTSDIEPASEPVVVQVTNGTDFVVGETAGDGVNPVGMVGIAGDHGTLLMFSNGVYEYDLNNEDPKIQALGDSESLADVFTYTITDGNGGFDTATLTIAICGTSNGPKVRYPPAASQCAET